MARTSDNDINLRQAVNDVIDESNAGNLIAFRDKVTDLWEEYFSDNQASESDGDVLTILVRLLNRYNIGLAQTAEQELLRVQQNDVEGLSEKLAILKQFLNSGAVRTGNGDELVQIIKDHFSPLIINMFDTTDKDHLSAIPEIVDRLSLAARKLRSEASYQVPNIAFDILERDPESAYAYAIWGMSLLQLDNENDALSAFDTALMLQPTCTPALGGKILLMVLQGRLDGVDFELSYMRKMLSCMHPDHAKQFAMLLDTAIAPSSNDIRYLCIGGGPAFDHPHWHNLEAVESQFNPEPFEMNPDCLFPFSDSSIELVYSSHCIEHLDDPTVDRILDESFRVLKPDGALVLKIPDFDRCLSDWQSGSRDFMFSTTWGLPKLLPLWNNRGVEDTVHSRSTMMFCGFWNDAYGGAHGHFSAETTISTEAYHGPAILDNETLENLISTETPHGVAKALRRHVIENEESYHFNHQNAWSRAELDALLIERGFNVLSFDIEKIIRRYHWVPDVERYDGHSTYCIAIPTSPQEHR
jgi:SAM-dependent methyltransferase